MPEVRGRLWPLRTEVLDLRPANRDSFFNATAVSTRMDERHGRDSLLEVRTASGWPDADHHLMTPRPEMLARAREWLLNDARRELTGRIGFAPREHDLAALLEQVAADEREACAVECESVNVVPPDAPASIRLHIEVAEATKRLCAVTIRARGSDDQASS